MTTCVNAHISNFQLDKPSPMCYNTKPHVHYSWFSIKTLNNTAVFYVHCRLISWTGRKIDPVGVDYILQKLGFHHARTTIPKWLQRGVMDPLDKVLSVLIKKLGNALQDEKEKKGGRDKEEH